MSDATTKLHKAVGCLDVEAVRRCLSDPDVNVARPYSDSPVMAAISKIDFDLEETKRLFSFVEICQMLLSHSSYHATLTDTHGKKISDHLSECLYALAKRGHVKFAERLLTLPGVDVNHSEGGKTPLMVVGSDCDNDENSCVSMLHPLVQHGSNLDAQDDTGQTVRRSSEDLWKSKEWSSDKIALHLGQITVGNDVELLISRLIIAGAPSGGKTSLVHSLLKIQKVFSGDKDGTFTTECLPWNISDNSVLPIYDLGGHQFTTHFFLHSFSILLFVHNIEQVNKKECKLMFSQVKESLLLTPKCKVMFALSQVDKIPIDDISIRKEQFKELMAGLIEDELQHLSVSKRYLMEDRLDSVILFETSLKLVVKQVFTDNIHTFSNVDGTGLDKLRCDIIDMILEMERTIPEECLLLYKKLGELKMKCKSFEAETTEPPTQLWQKISYMENSCQNLEQNESGSKVLNNLGENCASYKRNQLKCVCVEDAYRTYLDLIKDEGADDDQRKTNFQTCLDYLNSAGLLVWLKNLPKSKSVVLHHCDFFDTLLKTVFSLEEKLPHYQFYHRTGLVSKVHLLSDMKILRRNGKVSSVLLNAILSAMGLEEHMEESIELLQTLKLGYKIANSDRMFIPWLTSNSIPDHLIAEIELMKSSTSNSVAWCFQFLGYLCQTLFFPLCTIIQAFANTDSHAMYIWHRNIWTKLGHLKIHLEYTESDTLLMDMACDLRTDQSSVVLLWEFAEYIHCESRKLQQSCWPAFISDILLQCPGCVNGGLKPHIWMVEDQLAVKCDEVKGGVCDCPQCGELPAALIHPLTSDSNQRIRDLINYLQKEDIERDVVKVNKGCQTAAKRRQRRKKDSLGLKWPEPSSADEDSNEVSKHYLYSDIQQNSTRHDKYTTQPASESLVKFQGNSVDDCNYHSYRHLENSGSFNDTSLSTANDIVEADCVTISTSHSINANDMSADSGYSDGKGPVVKEPVDSDDKSNGSDMDNINDLGDEGFSSDEQQSTTEKNHLKTVNDMTCENIDSIADNYLSTNSPQIKTHIEEKINVVTADLSVPPSQHNVLIEKHVFESNSNFNGVCRSEEATSVKEYSGDLQEDGHESDIAEKVTQPQERMSVTSQELQNHNVEVKKENHHFNKTDDLTNVFDFNDSNNDYIDNLPLLNCTSQQQDERIIDQSNGEDSHSRAVKYNKEVDLQKGKTYHSSNNHISEADFKQQVFQSFLSDSENKGDKSEEYSSMELQYNSLQIAKTESRDQEDTNFQRLSSSWMNLDHSEEILQRNGGFNFTEENKVSLDLTVDGEQNSTVGSSSEDTLVKRRPPTSLALLSSSRVSSENMGETKVFSVQTGDVIDGNVGSFEGDEEESRELYHIECGSMEQGHTDTQVEDYDSTYTKQLQNVLGIELRVNDALPQTENTDALIDLTRDEPYQWNNVNEPSFADFTDDDFPATGRIVNRPIYEQLKRIDWVMGYFSTGGVIDVFVDLEMLDRDWVLAELCRITGQAADKFTVKDNNEEWAVID